MHLDWPVDRIPEATGDAKGTLWIDVEDPPGQPSAFAEHLLREVFRFHPLAVDDALRESHIPKIDDWDDIGFRGGELERFASPKLLKEWSDGS